MERTKRLRGRCRSVTGFVTCERLSVLTRRPSILIVAPSHLTCGSLRSLSLSVLPAQRWAEGRENAEAAGIVFGLAAALGAAVAAAIRTTVNVSHMRACGICTGPLQRRERDDERPRPAAPIRTGAFRLPLVRPTSSLVRDRTSGPTRPSRSRLEAAGELVAVDLLGREDARDGAVSALSRPRRMCSQPIFRSPRRWASDTARSSACLALAPQVGLVRRQLAGRSTPLASIPTLPSTRSKSRWSASRSSWGSSPASRRARPALPAVDAIEMRRCSASTLLDPRPAATLVASSAA